MILILTICLLIATFLPSKCEDGHCHAASQLKYEAKLRQFQRCLFDSVPILESGRSKRILVTGGAGFVGSHLVDRLLLAGHRVVVLDNFYTGTPDNLLHWQGFRNFELKNHDVVDPIKMNVDQIYHLASPASPPNYMADSVKTIKTNVLGTINILDLAREIGARVLLGSTSEVYGDPQEHPQSETYWGHVNPIGPRACYDESKRISETLFTTYAQQYGVDVRIARIFNTYGPRMQLDDGRVVSNFLSQAIQGQPLTIYGDGSQTRSFQYVSDLVEGLVRLMNSVALQGESQPPSAASSAALIRPVNIGNPDERSILQLINDVQTVIFANQSSTEDISRSELKTKLKPMPVDDPRRRRPNIERAGSMLNGWHPEVSLGLGLARTASYFRYKIANLEDGKRGEGWKFFIDNFSKCDSQCDQ